MRLPVWIFLLLFSTLTGCASWNLDRDKTNPEEKKTNLIDTKTVLAIELAKSRNYRSAINTINEAIALDNSRFASWMAQAYIYQSMKNNIAAQSAYSKALSLSPHNAEINNAYGWFVCDSLKNPGGSLAYFDRAAADLTNPNIQVAYMNKGICLSRLGQYDQAKEMLRQAMAAAPNFPYSFLEMARLYDMQGHYIKAKQYLDRYDELNPPPRPEDLSFAVRLADHLHDNDLRQYYINQLKKYFPYAKETWRLLH